jgi:hypothetical protein
MPPRQPADPPPPQPPPDRRIEALLRCLSELEAFDPASVVKHNDIDMIRAIQASTYNALEAAFGRGTINYDRFEVAADFSHGLSTLQLARALGRGGALDKNTALQANLYLKQSQIRAIDLIKFGAIPTLRQSTAPPSDVHGHDDAAKSEQDSTMEWDVFISHASEDKENFVRPLANRLHEQGLRVWFDEFTLTIGDSLRRSIDHGLAKSRFGIVVISPEFLRKEWPQKELDGLVAREIEGVKVILPVWHNIGAKEIRTYSPTLADRLAVASSQGLDRVTAQLLEAIRRGPSPAGRVVDPAARPAPQSHSPTEHRQFASDLHKRRIAEILADKGAAAVMDGGALVMHVVPVSAIGDAPTEAFENIAGNPEKFSPMGSSGGRDYRISYDGLVVGSNNEGLSKPQRAYVSVMRHGVLEAVQSSLAGPSNFIVLPQLQASIIKYAQIYTSSLNGFSVLAPFAVCISLIDVQGKTLLQDFVPRGALIVDLPSIELNRNLYDFGQVIFETIAQDYNGAAKALRPILTHLANAAGLRSSPYFDAAGNYTIVDKL